MKTALTLFSAVGVVSLLASSALAQEPSSSTATAAASKMSVGAQFELLPLGSAKATIEDQEFDSEDTAVAYGISAAFDYALTPFLKIGAAPRLILNVAPADDDGEEMDSDTAIDLRLRLLAHFPVAPKLQAYASLTPGYSIIMSSAEGVDNATGFAIGAAAGVSYDVSPAMFINGEVGYQRAFTGTSATVLDQTIDMDLDLSYLHVGVGAGTRF